MVCNHLPLKPSSTWQLYTSSLVTLFSIYFNHILAHIGLYSIQLPDPLFSNPSLHDSSSYPFAKVIEKDTHLTSTHFWLQSLLQIHAPTKTLHITSEQETLTASFTVSLPLSNWMPPCPWNSQLCCWQHLTEPVLIAKHCRWDKEDIFAAGHQCKYKKSF